MYFKRVDTLERGTLYPTHLMRRRAKLNFPSKSLVHVLKVRQLSDSQRRPKRHHKSIRNTNTFRENTVQSTFNIAGLEKIIHSPKHWHTVIWVCAFVAFYGLCIYQLVDRITLYFEAPIVLDVTIEKVTTIEFPSVTVCPSFGTAILYYKYCQQIRKQSPVESMYFAETNFTLEDIWEEFGIKEKDIKTTGSCSQSDDKTEKTEKNEKKEQDNTPRRSCGNNLKKDVDLFPTFWGNCLRITPTTKLSYRGAWTYIKFEVRRIFESLPYDWCLQYKKLMQLENETLFIPHSRDSFPTHDLAKLFYRVSKGSEVTVSFQLKRYKFLSTKNKPCVNEKTAADCRHLCLENSLNKTVKCRLPYMGNSSLEPCKSFMHGDRAQEAVEKAYKEFDHCNCHRPCEETLIIFASDFHATKDDKTIFSLNYPDNAVELITERVSYTFSSLLSDIGGNLGFCVGLCLFSFVEIIVSTEQLIREKRSRRTGKPVVVKLPKRTLI